jgi:hypothetical protein
MRKSFLIAPIFALALTALVFIINGSSQSLGADGLYLVAPDTCPDGGCAAGQRLNFTVEFTVETGYGVCFYASDGFVETNSITIDQTGKLSNAEYLLNESSITTSCSNNIVGDEILLASATAPTISEPNDQLDFRLNIDAATSLTNGTITVRIIDPGENPALVVAEHTINSIEVAALTSTVYVAGTPAACSAHTPCFVNTLEDDADGLGTGLRDAVRAVVTGSTVRVLGDYPIKDNTVLIDKNIILSGYADSSITYTGSDCSLPMLSITNGGTLQNLNIDDGSCVSTSRTLVQVNSAADVQIENNTFTDGKYAVEVRNNNGDVQIAFNELLDNDGYAVLTTSGANNGEVWIYANNILNNGTVSQVLCNSTGNADHNYWGDNEEAEDNAENCTVSNDKQLGAPILASDDGPGVEALRKTVTATKSYVFNSKLSVSHTTGSDYSLIVVNHGQGSADNVPFYSAVGDAITPCSNYYDVFTLMGSAPSDLVLSLKYDLNDTCLSTIETSDYCTGTTSANYPLWWYDPANNVTDGWDTVGQAPEGTGAGGASGQVTTCNTAINEIQVAIDNTGRPGLSNDLSFTPFFTGYISQSGIKLSQLTAYFDITQDVIKWTTTEERNIKGFHILRADTQNGAYSRISPLIESIGDTYIGGIYTYTDSNITFTKTYYYKLEVIGDSGDSIGTYGPVGVLTSTATPTTTPTRTATVTRTPTNTRTATPYYYRSPTSYYRPATATPRSLPTQVRTYGATATGTSSTKPTYNPTSQGTSQWDEAYPVTTQVSQAPPGYPAPEVGEDQTPTPTPQSTGEADSPDRDPDNGQEPGPEEDTPPDATPAAAEVRWSFLALGVASGFVLLGVIGVVLARLKIL